MQLAVFALLSVFAVLWIAPSVWIVRAASTVAAARRARVTVLAFLTCALAAAGYWYVPLSVQNGLQAIAASASPQVLNLSCSQMTEARQTLKSTGQGMILLDDDGTLRVKADLWRALSSEQQTSMLALARTASNCAGDRSGPNGTIVDIDTNAILNSK